MLGVFLDRDTTDNGDLDLSVMESLLDDWRYFGLTPHEKVGQRIRDADVVVSNKARLEKADLLQAKNLKLVCIAATGFDHVDLAAARELGIKVCNVRTYATPSVIQHVFAMILALRTQLLRYQRAVAAGRWQQSSHFSLLDYPIDEIAGKTLGIIGYGELGRGVAAVARAFGMDVLVMQRPGSEPDPARVSMQEILQQVDILSIHCPLTSKTKGMIGRRELSLMKQDAILINTARGGIVDELALVEALRTGRLGGAGIDVLTQEPPSDNHPLLQTDIPNLIVTPHIAWASRQSRQRLIDKVAENIRAFLDGVPQNIVT